jgi:ubiquinone/menaquinone biosynthesis C-methylase UbiE
VSSTASAVGRLLPAVSSALRPPARTEIEEYGGLGLIRRKRVIDIGCGDGRLALGCAPYAAEVAGVDPDPEAIRAARAKAHEAGATNVKFHEGVAQELPYPNEHFDVAILSWTL